MCDAKFTVEGVPYLSSSMRSNFEKKNNTKNKEQIFLIVAVIFGFVIVVQPSFKEITMKSDKGPLTP